jgi:hypothetical protein
VTSVERANRLALAVSLLNLLAKYPEDIFGRTSPSD